MARCYERAERRITSAVSPAHRLERLGLCASTQERVWVRAMSRHQRYDRAARMSSKQRYAVGDVVRYVGPVKTTMLAGYRPSEKATWRRFWEEHLGQEATITYINEPRKSYSHIMTLPQDAYMKIKFSDSEEVSLRANQVEYVSSGGGVPEEPRMVYPDAQYEVGQRVVLAEFDNGDEIIPEETGVVEDYSPDDEMYIITVDDEYLNGEDDDGLREVMYDQIKGLA